MSTGYNTGSKRIRARAIPDWSTQINRGSLSESHLDKPTGIVTTLESIGPQFVHLPGNPQGQQVTVDENHMGSGFGSMKKGQFTGDIGGEFESTRHAVFASSQGQHLYRTAENASVRNRSDYFGPILPIAPWSIVPVSDPGSQNLDQLGTTAIKRLKPTNNVANLAVDLAEAKRDGLPKLWGVNSWKEKTSLAHKAGDEYLNQEFGWAPLTSDIRGACYAAANAHKILSSYERNSGKMVRRRYEFPVERSEVWSTVNPSTAAWANIPNGMFGSGQLVDLSQTKGSVIKCHRFYRRTWFSGAFTYHLPLGFKSRNEVIAAASKAGPLLGIELTPEVVWNAIPWTWALNWVSNVGDLVSNFSDMSVDGLVIKYGYMMEHTVTSDTYYFNGLDGYYPAQRNRPGSITSFFERKKRVKATPFGFEIGWSSLSPRQLAISAALGLTRVF